MNPFKTKKFKDLQKKWYSKLKEEGFKEIEDTNSDKEFIKTWDSKYFSIKYKASPDAYEAKAEYYRAATSFLESHQFKDVIEKEVWSMHAEGFSLRDTATELKIKIWVARMIVNNLKKIMSGK